MQIYERSGLDTFDYSPPVDDGPHRDGMTTLPELLPHPKCRAAHRAGMPSITAPTAPLWTLEQVSEFTATPLSTLYSLRSAGRGPSGFRIGRSLRFRPEDVSNWIEELIDADRSAA